MKKSRIIRMLSEVIEDKQTGKQFWFDLDLYKHERDWPKPLSTKDICTKMELNTTYEFRSEEALMKRINDSIIMLMIVKVESWETLVS